jgi:integrase
MGGMRAIETSTTAKDGARFKVRYRLDGRQTSETFLTYDAADEFRRLLDTIGPLEASLIVHERDAAPEGGLTLAHYAERHVESLTGVGEGYRERCRRMVARDLAVLGHRPLTAITSTAIAAWVNGLERAGQSGKTIKNKHGFLSAVMAHAVRDGLVPANPCAGTRLPRTVAPSMTFLTPDEFAVFLGYVTPHWQPMVSLMFGTGLRFSELTALNVADADLDHGTLSVTKAWKDGGKRIGPPKSRRSVRTISLAPESVLILRELCAGRPGDALLLRNQIGTAVRLQTFHDNVWGPAVRLANGEPAARGKRVGRRRDARGDAIEPAAKPLGKRPRPHDARHTCASWLLAAGAPLNVVQAHLGHESITTTVDRYGHLMPSARAAVSSALSVALTNAHPQIEG